MALFGVTDRSAVLQAIAEFDAIGRDAFLQRYGFGPARRFYLRHEGKLYDSKAIVGAAHGFQHRDAGPLRAADFSGGDATVRRKLEQLGFRLEVLDPSPNPFASEHLIPGQVYTRADLKQQFGITDATINTGVFRPNGFDSVWLFVTEEKPADRTPYRDFLDGDLLHWQGQTSGRTDPMIIQHRERGLELLLFYRRTSSEHPGAGFRYEGPFEHVGHEGSGPTSFVLRRERPLAEASVEAELAAAGAFSPTNVEDARRKALAAIVQRRGQRAFREAVMQAYGSRCAVTGCGVTQILEAAHIHPYRGEATNHVTNGLLLRADIHTLFDCGLLVIDEDMRVRIAPALEGSEYERFDGQPLRPAARADLQPSAEAIQAHREEASV